MENCPSNDMMISCNEICTYIGAKLFHAHLVKKSATHHSGHTISDSFYKCFQFFINIYLVSSKFKFAWKWFIRSNLRVYVLTFNCSSLLNFIQFHFFGNTIYRHYRHRALEDPPSRHELQALFGTFHKKSYLAQYQTHFSLQSLDQMWTTPIKCPVKYMDGEKLWAYWSISK